MKARIIFSVSEWSSPSLKHFISVIGLTIEDCNCRASNMFSRKEFDLSEIKRELVSDDYPSGIWSNDYIDTLPNHVTDYHKPGQAAGYNLKEYNSNS